MNTGSYTAGPGGTTPLSPQQRAWGGLGKTDPGINREQQENKEQRGEKQPFQEQCWAMGHPQAAKEPDLDHMPNTDTSSKRILDVNVKCKPGNFKKKIGENLWRLE